MSKERTAPPAQRAKAPNPVLIVVCIIIAAAIASYIVPAGAFDRVTDPNTGRSVVDPASFHAVEQNPATPFDVFLSIPLGIQGASSIIAFLLIIGGAFGMMEATGAIKAAMGALVRKMQGREMLMIPVCMLVFSLGAAFAANNEELLPFLPLILSMCFAMGFDSLTALGILFGSVAAGYGAGCTNTFTVGVAQGIAGLPTFSGIELRLVILVVLYAVNVTFVMLHARKVKKNPQLSPMYDLDRERAQTLVVDDTETLTTRHILVLLAFVATIIALIVGVLVYHFFTDELAALFLIMGVAAGVLGGLTPREMAESFVKGCQNLLFPALMVGMCRAITIILNDASVMDSIINFMAGLLNSVPSFFTAFGMFIVQDVFNILVPSGSGQAAITMPIMAPLADLVGVTRQTAVLAYQMGDAFTNCITPASGMTMSCLAIAGVPLNKWWKFILPLIGIWWVVAFVFLSYATAVGFGPF